MKTKKVFLIIYFLMIFFSCIAQNEQKKFWALNQCETLFGKYKVQLPATSLAYSVRKLYCNYNGPSVRVRISGGSYNGSIGDVSFYAGNVIDANSNVSIVSGTGTGTTVLFSTFYAGATTNAYVVTWYDQSGSGNNATQSTAAYQPQVVSNGALITDNGYPTVQFTDSHTTMYLSLNTAVNLSNGSLFGVYRVVNGSYTCGIAQSASYSYNFNTWNGTATGYGKIGVTQYTVTDAASVLNYNTVLDLASWSKSSANNYVEINTRTANSTASLNIPIAFSQIYGNSYSGTNLHLSEVILTAYASTAQRALIFNNQRSFFNTP